MIKFKEIRLIYRVGAIFFSSILAALSLSAGAKPASVKKASSCQKQLLAPKKSKRANSLNLALKLDYGRDELNAFFQANQETMAAQFDRARLKELIEIIAEGGSFNSAQKDEYKNLRYRLKAVRFAFVLFDQNHDCPSFIDDFIKVMGTLKDAFVNDKPDVARAAASELLVMLKNKNWSRFEDELNSFEPSSGKAFRRFVAQELDEIDDLLSRDGITGVEFHDIRKAVGRLLNLADTINSLDAKPSHAAIVDFLDTLYGKMGSVHNELVTKKLDGEIKYAKDPMELPDDIRGLLEILVSQFISEKN